MSSFMSCFLPIIADLFTVDIFLYLLGAFTLFAVFCLIYKVIYG